MGRPKAQNSQTRACDINIVSLFAGAGGLEIAACTTGRVHRIVSTDSNPTFLSTTQTNLGNHFAELEHLCLVADASYLNGEHLKDLMGGHVDIVMGGPPCDDFTRTGRRLGMRGLKAGLINEFARLVNELEPHLFIFENVPNLLEQFKGQFAQYLNAWRETGWATRWKVLKACYYGSPTIRRRLFVIGARNKLFLDQFKFPSQTHGTPDSVPTLFDHQNPIHPFVTVRDVLEDLPDVGSEAAKSRCVLNHDGMIHRASTIAHMQNVQPGQWAKKSFRYRAPLEGLCSSLIAGTDDSTKAHIHPTYHREMTVREYARIHGFPDTWWFAGTRDNGIKQVANAVPIPLGSAIWREVHRLFGTGLTA